MATICLSSVLCYGRNVLIIERANRKSESLRDALDSFIETNGLQNAIQIRRFTAQNASEFARRPPPFLICDSRDYCQAILNDDALASQYLTVACDDLNLMDVIERAHIPFLIDRHRWMVESNFRRFQFVATLGLLGPGGQDYVAARFLTSTTEVRQHFCKLRVPAGNLENVYQFKEGFDWDALIEKFDTLDSPPVQVHLCRSRKDAIGLLEANRITGNWIVIHSRISISDIKLLKKHDQNISIVCLGIVRETGATPVFANRNAQSFRVAHFLEHARTTKPRTPIPLHIARRFGLDISRIEPVEGSLEKAPAVASIFLGPLDIPRPKQSGPTQICLSE